MFAVLVVASLGSTLPSSAVYACSGHTFLRDDHARLVHEMRRHADVIVAGRVVRNVVESRRTIIEVLRTFKGERRDTWSFAWPRFVETPKFRYANLVVGRIVITVAKKDVPRTRKVGQRPDTPEEIAARPFRILKGGCSTTLIFDYSPRLDTRLELAFRPGAQAAAAERERILRSAFAFGYFYSYKNLRSTVRLSRRKMQRLDADKDGVLKPDEVPTIEAARAKHLYRWIRVPEILSDVHKAIRLFDADNDGAMSAAELDAAVMSAFRLYDTNDNGVVDDFEYGPLTAPLPD